MKKISKRIFSAILAMVMLVSMLPNSVFKASATAAVAQSEYITGDIINFGTYPQTKVTDTSLIASLNAQPLQGDSTTTYCGSTYKRVYFTQYTPYDTSYVPSASSSYQDDNGYYINTVYWFKFEPIQWRVLSNTNGELFVMAEKILDSKAYNQMNTNVTWETCSMRSWLNNDFYNTAFSSTEKSEINTSTVVNADNPWNGTEGGNNTNDKLYLLSYADTVYTAYGFSSYYNTCDAARQAQGTDFSKSSGLYVLNSNPYWGNSHWWLRTPGSTQYSACGVDFDGSVYDYYYYVNSPCVGVRPALKLNLSSGISTSINVSFDSYTQAIGSTLLIGADFSSSTLAFNSSTVSYEFSDPSAFSVTGGMTFTGTASSGSVLIIATALKAGTYTVTFSTSDGASSTSTIIVKEDVYQLKVCTTYENFSVPVGENLEFTVALYKNDVVVENVNSFTLAFDNSSVFSVTKTVPHKKGLDVTLKALIEGTVCLTMQDVNTNSIITLILTSTPEMNICRFNTVPVVQYAKDTTTNFYNIGGLCVDHFTYMKNSNDGSYTVSMNVYNTKNVYGAVTAYTENGKISDYDVIEKFDSYMQSLTDFLEQCWYLPGQIGSLFDKYSYTNGNISEKTEVSVKVPKDGYIKITNNSAESTVAYLYDVINFAVSGTYTAAGIMSTALGLNNLDKVTGAVVKETVSEMLAKCTEDSLTALSLELGEQMTKGITYDQIDQIISITNGLLANNNINLSAIISDCSADVGISVAEAAFTSFLGTPGTVLNSLFSLNKGISHMDFSINFVKSSSNQSVLVYAPLGGDTQVSNGIEVTPQSGNFEANTILHTFAVTDGNTLNLITGGFEGAVRDFKVYNITLYKNGYETQPNQKVRVMIPIPQGYNKNTLMVYRYNDDGTFESMAAVVEGDYAVFETEHFSNYILADMVPAICITKDGNSLSNVLQIKVPWYRSYKNSKNDIQLGFSTNMGADVTAVWSSDNPNKVQVDQTGKVKNLKIGARSANITVNLVDDENNVIATDSLKVIFYKYKWQLKKLQTQSFVSDNYAQRNISAQEFEESEEGESDISIDSTEQMQKIVDMITYIVSLLRKIVVK